MLSVIASTGFAMRRAKISAAAWLTIRISTITALNTNVILAVPSRNPSIAFELI